MFLAINLQDHSGVYVFSRQFKRSQQGQGMRFFFFTADIYLSNLKLVDQNRITKKQLPCPMLRWFLA